MQGGLPAAESAAHELKGRHGILLILWLAGFGFHFGGGLIHLLLVVALILLIYNLATGRRTLA